MSKNTMIYENLYAFHPGSYVEEIIEDLDITQKEFAKRLDVTEKTLSKLVNGEIRLSKEVAQKLSNATGVSLQSWLNLQNRYDEEVLKIETAKEQKKEEEIVKKIDYSYLKKLGIVKNEAKVNIFNKIKNIREALNISSLRYLTELPNGVSYRNKSQVFDEKTIINSNIMVEIALKKARSIEAPKLNINKLNEFLSKIKGYTIEMPEYSTLVNELKKAGIILVALPHLKNAGINGAVKKLNSGSVMLLINDRGKSADIFWFSLLHEFSHILNNEYEINLVGNDCDSDNEKRADKFARDLLIEEASYKEFVYNDNFSRENVVNFANKVNIDPGIVVGRLQNDGYVDYRYLNNLKKKLEIKVIN